LLQWVLRVLRVLRVLSSISRTSFLLSSSQAKKHAKREPASQENRRAVGSQIERERRRQSLLENKAHEPCLLRHQHTRSN
jgi:hypothetical protein